jgi:hypothetical protein
MRKHKSGKIAAWSLISCISILAAMILLNANTSESIAVDAEQPLSEQITNADTALSEKSHAGESYSVGISVKCNVIVK